MTDFSYLRPPLHFSGDLDLLSILVVSVLVDSDGSIWVVDLGRGGKGWSCLMSKKDLFSYSSVYRFLHR
jgi:hypothetical protein